MSRMSQIRPPDCRIVYSDLTIDHGTLEHRVDDQIETHPRTVSAYRTLPEGDHRKSGILDLKYASLTLKFGDPVWIPTGRRRLLIVELILGIAVNGTRRSVDISLHTRLLCDEGEICW